MKDGKAPEKPKETDLKDKTEEEIEKANKKFDSDTAIYEKLKEVFYNKHQVGLVKF